MSGREDKPSPEQLRAEAAQIERTGKAGAGKRPSAVAGGKKAAAARKERGRKGGQRRGGKTGR